MSLQKSCQVLPCHAMLHTIKRLQCIPICLQKRLLHALGVAPNTGKNLRGIHVSNRQQRRRGMAKPGGQGRGIPTGSPSRATGIPRFAPPSSLDGPIRANRFADSRESPDSRESCQGPRTEPLFCESHFGG